MDRSECNVQWYFYAIIEQKLNHLFIHLDKETSVSSLCVRPNEISLKTWENLLFV